MNKRKKILFVVNYLKGGGVERMLVNIVKSTHQNFDVEVLSIYNVDSSYVAEALQYCNIKFLDTYRNKFNSRFLTSVYSRLYDKENVQRILFKSFLKHNHYDYVVAFSEGFALSLVADTKIPNVKKVSWIHTDFLNDPKWIEDNKSKLRNKFEKYDDIVFVSGSLENKFKNILQLKFTTCIDNGVDIRRVKELADEFEPKHDKNRFEFVSVGRLGREKGHDVIIDALSLLDTDVLNKCHLTIVGGGEIENELRYRVKSLGLDSVVTFTGFIENPYPYIKSAGALILASKYEGFGLVLVESMALNTPVISTKTEGASYVVENGKYGILVSEDIRMLSETIKSITLDATILNDYIPRLSERTQFFSIEKFNKSVKSYFSHE